jgi:hypothetical protein
MTAQGKFCIEEVYEPSTDMSLVLHNLQSQATILSADDGVLAVPTAQKLVEMLPSLTKLPDNLLRGEQPTELCFYSRFSVRLLRFSACQVCQL